ncbi:MAG: hypothetical protein ABH877_04240, partial [bacterium]
MRITSWKFGGIGAMRGDVEIPIEELGDAKLVAVCGNNGAGRTTTMESIPGAIYGDTPSRGAVARLANRRDSFIEIGMEVAGSPIEAKLLINGVAKTPKTEAYLTSAGDPLSDGKIGSYKAAVATRFPAESVYLASGFAAQGGGGAFLDIKKAERKDLFLELLGSGRLSEISKTAGERASKVAFDIETKRAAVDSAMRLAGDVASLELLATTKDAALLSARGNLSVLEARAVAAEAAAEEWRERLLALTEQVAAAGSRHQSVAAELRSAEAVVAEIEREIAKTTADAAAARARLANRDQLSSDASGYGEALARTAGINAEITARRAEEESYREELAAWQERRTAAEDTYREVRAAWKERRAAAEQAYHELVSAWDFERRVAEKDLKRAESDVEILTAASGKLGSVPCGGEGEFGACPLISAAVNAGKKLTVATELLGAARAEVERTKPEPAAVATAAEAKVAAGVEPKAIADALAEGLAVGPAPEKPDPGVILALERSRKDAQSDEAKALSARVRLEELAIVEEQLDTIESAGREVAARLESALAGVPPLQQSVDEAAGEVASARGAVSAHEESRPESPDRAELAAARQSVEMAVRESGSAAEKLAAARLAEEAAASTRAEIDALTADLDDWSELRWAFGKDGIQA